ncbi:glycosyltransferase family A protein [Nocardioides sp. InS609-2]|uniref:glycosyltransferase n=1 Tax=Nocardioides sp. InS609-2 TaxID=2760705 RepID=UPI0020C0DEF2|nr:glycosyltransferase family A protein [Nocardioides sp. InS609-2]
MPRQTVVRHNDWSVLTPPALGQWEPTKTVTMVVPAYNYHRTLPYVLAGLAAQSYPAHLMEVVVVDDQSTPPLELPEVRPDNTRILRVESGWGRANAAHLGALASDGEVLHWYDADMLAHRQEVEAQLRWHHLIDYAVPGGDKRFVDPASLFDRTPTEVRDVVAEGGAADLFPGEEHEKHTWVEGFWKRTDDLRKAGPRAQRVHIGMTGSVSRDLYFSSRGFDPMLRLGEDMAVGHELAQAGGVFIVDREAMSWHLGRSQVLRRAELVNRYNDPYLANLVPAMRPKRNRHGRTYEVPYLEVVVPLGPADETVRVVDALLDSSVPDLRVVVVGPWDDVHEDRIQPVEDPVLETRIVHRSYRGEPRVRLVSSVDPDTDAEFRLTLPGVAFAPSYDAMGALLDDLERTHHGERIIAFPDGSTTRLTRIAARARVERLLDEGEDPDALMAAAFGLVEYDAARAGFLPIADRVVERFELRAKPAMDPAASSALLDEKLSRSDAEPEQLGDDRRNWWRRS